LVWSDPGSDGSAGSSSLAGQTAGNTGTGFLILLYQKLPVPFSFSKDGILNEMDKVPFSTVLENQGWTTQ
jgi:hypothetical protein